MKDPLVPMIQHVHIHLQSYTYIDDKYINTKARNTVYECSPCLSEEGQRQVGKALMIAR